MNTIATTTEITINTTPKRNKNAKPVICITNGCIYASAMDAAIAEHTTVQSISKNCLGKTKAIKGKTYCYIADINSRILELSNNMNCLYVKAMKFEELEKAKRIAERKAQRKAQLISYIARSQARLERMQRELSELA